jgi:hypothetical protein
MIKTPLAALLGAILTLATFAADAPHAHHGMSSAAAELGADGAFDAHGVLWIVHKVDGRLAVSRSADEGRTWSKPLFVTPAPEPTDSGGDARPKLALGPRGELYVTWTKPLSKPYTGEVKFSRSLDGGRSFSTPLVVHHDRQEITHRFDTLAVNARGEIFVAWIDKRDAAAAPETPAYRGAAVYFAVSNDRGASFRGDFKVAEHSCECCRIALAAQPDGTVAALWRHIFEPNIRDHATATLHADGTVTGFARATVDDWHIDVCPHQGPGLAEDADGRRHAVWFTAAPPHPGVFYAALGANGATSPRKIGGETAEHADLAVAGQRLAIAWKEFDGHRTQLRAMTSDDAGASWKEAEVASTAGASAQPRVLTSGRERYVLWNTHDEGLTVSKLP